MKVTATMGAWGIATTNVYVNIVLGCPDTTITPVTVPNQIYYITFTALTFSFIDWTSSVSGCTPFTYTATYNDGSALVGKITFNAGTKTFTVTSSTYTDVGTYYIRIIGSLASGVFAPTTFSI